MLALLSNRHTTVRDTVKDFACYRDPQRARHDLESPHAVLPDPLFQSLKSLLSASPDPDQSLNLFQRLLGDHPDASALMVEHPVLLPRVVAIFGHSFWLGETVLRHPDLLQDMANDKGLERSLERDDYSQRFELLRGREGNEDIALLLTQFKKREYIRIALRDAQGIATLGETVSEISALADVIIQCALRESAGQMEARYGKRSIPGSFAVLAMGKLGGNELNYSSDLDLLYLYDGNESTEMLSSSEYFIRQAQLLTGILSWPTEEGALFRVDLRLRPQGREGEPAVSLQHALDYYCSAARDWEFQALIKARHVAGDPVLSQSFLRGVQDRVYTERLNFAAIETALRSRRQMDARRHQAMALSRPHLYLHLADVKLDPGGIRDIEFLVQCLQRVYGGAEPWLRSGGTLFSLQKLHDKDHLDTADFHQLSQAYQFLRCVEHRLQLRRGRQVHRLPDSGEEIEVLERAMGLGNAREPRSILLKVHSHMDRVNEIYRRIVHNEKARHNEKTREDRVTSVAAPFVPEQDRSFVQVVERIAARSGQLADRIRATHLTPHAQRALSRFSASLIAADQSQLGPFEDEQIFQRVLLLLETSEFLEGMLCRYPELISFLDDPACATRPISAEAASEEAAPASDLTETMVALRRRFREHIFRSGAQDIVAPAPRPALDSMRETTAAAEAAIRQALGAVGVEQRIAIFAFGRLGTHEFDIASDADLIFVRQPGSDPHHARVIAEKLVHVVAAYTRDGALFAVDARLRPHGGEGELVVTPSQLETYLADEALAWEALTYSKIRFIAGDHSLAGQVLEQVSRRITQIAHEPSFAGQVLEMRGRLEKSNRYARSFKLARGGFYDIDFIASFLMLRHASLHEGNTLDRLEHLQRAGFLDRTSFAALANATVLFRTADHAIRLVTGRARPELPQSGHAREATIRLVHRILQRGGDVQADLDAAQEQVRKLFVELIRE